MSEGLPPCKDFELCGNQSDPRYTMDFTDVEPGAFIYWCAKCGPFWSVVNDNLIDALKESPEFAKKFEAELDKVKQ